MKKEIISEYFQSWLDKNSKVIIGLFWGGISQPGTNEMIHCFTPYDVIWDFLKKQL